MTADIPFITAKSLKKKPNWQALVDALVEGHKKPKAHITDSLITRGSQSLLNRAAWIDGLGSAVKTVTVYPDNPKATPARPSVHGAAMLFDDHSGQLKAIIDSGLITYWKTAADSLLGAKLLGPKAPSCLLIMGAGVVARSLIDAYTSLYPSISNIILYARRPEAVQALLGALTAHQKHSAVTFTISENLADDVAKADIVATATASHDPVLKGDWLTNGTHVDLIGAYTPAMREADNATLLKGDIYVDSRETTLDHIGELLIPLKNGVIQRADVKADFYDLITDLIAGQQAGTPHDREHADITIFKNGGGAHLDLMTAHYLLTCM